jgi:hypothetical protein
MNSFRQLFSSRGVKQDVPYRETSFDHFLRFCLQGAFRKAEPSPAVWNRIEHLLERPQLPPNHSFLHRFAGNWSRQMSSVMHIMFTDSNWSDRLDERKMDLFTQMMPFPGLNAMGLAVA